MKKIIRFFLQGLLYIVPIAVTIYVIVTAINWMDHLVIDRDLFKQSPLANYNFPGVGLVIILVFITVIGFIGQRLISTPLSSGYNKVIKKAPLVKMIYSSVKDLMSAFVGSEKKFDKTVIVDLDKTGTLHRLGFITAKDLSELGIKDMIAVYLPSSYGMLGELYIVNKEQVKPIEANSADVMKFVVSGGVTHVEKKDL